MDSKNGLSNLYRIMYWSKESEGIFPAMNHRNVMSCHCFEDITRFLQVSIDDSPEHTATTFSLMQWTRGSEMHWDQGFS